MKKFMGLILSFWRVGPMAAPIGQDTRQGYAIYPFKFGKRDHDQNRTQ